MKRVTNLKRLLSMILVVAMLATLASPAMAVESDGVSFTKVDNSSVTAQLPGREPVELPQEESPYGENDVVRVSIFLEKAGTIEAGYETFNIARNNSAMNYRAGLKQDQETLVQKIEKATNEELDVVWNLTLAANLISANVKYGQIEAIEALPGVRNVVIETQYFPDVVSTGAADPNMATSGAQIGSSAAWAAGYTGAGSKIAIIDTGVDVEHEAFNADAYDYSLSLLDGEFDLMDEAEIAAVLTELHAYKRAGVNAEGLYVNSKVPFGFNYIDKDLDITHVNDAQGEHGSHVAGIATANAYVENADGTFSYALDTTFVQGVAPDAQLLVMKVFGKGGGAYDSDYMAAIEDAIILGADSINLSLGSGNPGMSRADGSSEELGAYQDILDSLEKSGVVVAMSAGNSGYWVEKAENGLPYLYLDDVSFQTNGSPGSYTNSLSVASVDNDGFTGLFFNVGGNYVSYSDTSSSGYGNAPMTTLAGTHEFVFVNAIGTPEDFAAVGGDVLAGKIVMCYRGTTSFYEKANAAVAAGAAGVVVVNNQEGIINLDLTGYQYTAPVVSIMQADGEVFKAVGTENTTESGITYWTGSMDVSASMGAGQYNSEYYTMSSFSSWGVPGSLELKPEITAPGGSIYSVAGANIYDGSLLFGDHASYEVMSGTSMAAPQVAGMAAVLAQYIRESGLDEQTGLDERTLTQSLLMSTAEPILDGNTEYYYPVIQQGAGLANVGNAVMADSYILMLENATASYADGKVKAELGDDPNKTGVYSFSFTINNLTDVEKTFALSADVFTQDAWSYSGILLLDTWTTALTPTVTWTVDGKTVENGEDLNGLDFNGDGLVNSDDGQALLDYATGLDVTLYNTDKADLNSDGEINSYDSYLFLTMLNESGAVVPANGSATVNVTITLSSADKEWLANYENGAYIEAYVYAESLTTAEGVQGTTHSIPMLAYYGNWSDPSMFDKGSYVEFAYGLENRPPYLYGSNYYQGSYNGLLVTYADGTETWFGGNPFPLVPDDTYMPERNAISAANGDMISTIGFSAIRNAADSYYQVLNTTTGEYLINMQTGSVPSAYYYVNGGYWNNTYYTLDIGFIPEGVAEGNVLEVGITLIPEYYVDGDGSIDWDALGEGATFSMSMVVDNTAPVVDDVDISADNTTLEVTATDNQYIAAVALYDIYGQYLYTYTGSDAEQAAGDTVEFALDLSEVNGPSFLLQVYDYARNVTTYEITTQIGEVVDTIECIEISDTALVMQKGSTDQLTANVYPINASNRNVVWTSSDESVVTVDENGVVTAVAAGNAVVTATSAADETVTANCAIQVIDISADLNAIVWDEEGSIWYSQFNTADLPNYTKLSHDMLEDDYIAAACAGPDGTIYASSLNTSNGTGAIYTIDPETYEVTKLSDCVVQGLHIFYSDLTYVPAMFGTGMLLGTYGPFVMAIDPATGETLGIIDQYDSDLVGITACYGLYDPDSGVYQDVVYVIQNDGTVIQEIYYGYDGMVVPYMYYFSGMRAAENVGVDVGDAWYFNSAYYDGTYLYWSAFDEETQNNVTLYAIDADYTGDVYNLGQFADSVWPVAGLHENAFVNDEAAAAAKLAELPALFAENGMLEVQEIQLVKKEFVSDSQAAGGLNSVADYEPPVRPQSEALEDSKGTVTVTVTAKDATGTDVDSTNGVTTVTYDPTQMTLVGIKVEGDYYSFDPDDVHDDDGKVTFGYVALDGIAAGDAVATLYFEAKTTEEMTVTVVHQEVGNEESDYEEKLEVGCAHDLIEIVDAQKATCTEDGYTGDTYCTICGAMVKEGQVIPATGHQNTEVVGKKDATCTEDGYTGDTVCTDCDTVVTKGEKIPATGHKNTEVVGKKDATCTEDGYTGDTVCTDCDTVVTKGEKIPAHGHEYESVVTKPTAESEGYTTHTCVHCGDTYVDSYVDKIDPSNPGTGDDFNAGLLTALLLFSLAGIVTLVVIGKKWYRV